MDNSNNMTTSSSPTPGAPRQRKIHPLVATAAGAIIIASLAATAAVTGLFPKASSTSPTNDQTQAAQVVAQPATQSSTQPAEPTAAQQQQAQQDQLAQQQAQQSAAAQAAQQQAAQQQQRPAPQVAQQPVQQPNYAQQAPAQPAYCSTCGTVEAISAVRHEGQATGIGAVGGAVAGGLIGNQFGRGGGRTGMTILGALGGGLGGNAVEKHLRSTTDYSVRVHMENGKTRYFTYHQAPPFNQGERVRIENGTLVAG
ncbi:Outer membrane lipoprotein SlyB [Burkholderia sp. D7]|nr:Outer membrane lipoprotein SlyB [Burkholderia sp. D7]